EAKVVGNRNIKRPSLRITVLRQPIAAPCTRRSGLVVHRLDQRSPQSTAARLLYDEQVFQIAVAVGSPGRTMKEVVREPHELAIDIAAERKHRLVRVVKPHPRKIAGVPGKVRLVEREVTRP